MVLLNFHRRATDPMSDNLKLQVHGLSRLLSVAQQVRNAADLLEFGFLTVNETHSIVPYRQAVLWRATSPTKGVIEAVSGLAIVDAKAPFIHWMTAVLNLKHGNDIQRLGSADIKEQLGCQWQEWLPENGILLPLMNKEMELLGILFLARKEPWQDYELTILKQLTEIYSYTWAVLLGTRWYGARPVWLRKIVLSTVIVALAIVLFYIPINLSVLAPAEVVSQHPTYIRSPQAGVIDDFFVVPNQFVKKDQPLFQLDDTMLSNRLQIVRKSLAVVNAQFSQASKEAFSSSEVKAKLTILREQQEEKKAEVRYVEDLLEKIIVRADQDGIIIFNDVTDWLGKPVAIGEKIVELAKPDQVELKINLPIADAIVLVPGTKVLFFLNVDPENTQVAKLTYASYQAHVTPDGILSYHLKAQFNATSTPRLGLRGTAKIYGEKTNIFYLVMRRPLAAVRQKLGI